MADTQPSLIHPTTRGTLAPAPRPSAAAHKPFFAPKMLLAAPKIAPVAAPAPALHFGGTPAPSGDAGGDAVAAPDAALAAPEVSACDCPGVPSSSKQTVVVGLAALALGAGLATAVHFAMRGNR